MTQQTLTQAMIRPAWTPVTIAMMIIGFIVWWPLGLAMIAYIVWGDRLDQFKAEANRATDTMSGMFSRRQGGFAPHARSGNVAFDEWREEELKRLDEKRRELENMRAEFDTYARELRRAKDKEEFDTFMAHRAKAVDAEDEPKKVKKSGGKTVPGV